MKCKCTLYWQIDNYDSHVMIYISCQLLKNDIDSDCHKRNVVVDGGGGSGNLPWYDKLLLKQSLWRECLCSHDME